MGLGMEDRAGYFPIVVVYEFTQLLEDSAGPELDRVLLVEVVYAGVTSCYLSGYLEQTGQHATLHFVQKMAEMIIDLVFRIA